MNERSVEEISDRNVYSGLNEKPEASLRLTFAASLCCMLFSRSKGKSQVKLCRHTESRQFLTDDMRLLPARRSPDDAFR
jgi:hypothetical protein